jgi:hypothetical protein
VVRAYDFESRDKFLFPREGASGKLRAREGDGQWDGKFGGTRGSKLEVRDSKEVGCIAGEGRPPKV